MAFLSELPSNVNVPLAYVETCRSSPRKLKKLDGFNSDAVDTQIPA